MVPEAPLEPTEHGLVPAGDGWFVLNARETRWWDREGRGAAGDFDGEPEFPIPAARDRRLRTRAGRAHGDVPLGGRPRGLPRGLG
jgi:hypothetical protein